MKGFMPSKRFKIILAFAAVYLIWGSTYLAIRFAIETLPSFTMAGTRFLISGLLLWGYCAYRGIYTKPTLKQWGNASIVGGLLLLGGNGSVVWAEHYVSSGLAALIIAITPWWMVLVEWLFYKGERPHRITASGLILGLIGVGVLIGPALQGHLHLIGVVVLVLASLWWAIGSVYSRHADLPDSTLQSIAMQMIAGGIILLLVSVGFGEWGQWSASQFSSFVYLIVFGSFLGFTAYIWLLQEVGSALTSTYAFVNPLVAVILGCVFAGETLTTQTFYAAGLIVVAVILITIGQQSRNSKPLGSNG